MDRIRLTKEMLEAKQPLENNGIVVRHTLIYSEYEKCAIEMVKR